MPASIEGKKNAQGLKIGIVVSRYNHFITEKLLEGALDGFQSHGGEDKNMTIVRVPGAFEIPLIAEKMARILTMFAMRSRGGLAMRSEPIRFRSVSVC